MDLGKSDESVEDRGYFLNRRRIDGDGSDDGSDYSDDSEATVEQSKNNDSYVDVAKRPSTVKCNVAPEVFFKCRCHYGCISDKKISLYLSSVMSRRVRVGLGNQWALQH